MTSPSIVTRLLSTAPYLRPRYWWLRERAPLHELATHPQQLPPFVRTSTVAQHYLTLCGQLDWSCFPERDVTPPWHIPALPFAPFVAAYLVKLDQHLIYMSQLRRFLVDHPALVWLLGFPLTPSRAYPWGFDAHASLPTQRHFARVLRKMPNASLQSLLDETVRLLRRALLTHAPDFGQTIALDTKHILAWVKQNNPKAYVKDRFAKAVQPAGDPDCRLGCKRKRNQRASSQAPPPTPHDEPVPAHTIAVGEYHWGYASGIVTTKVPDWGEFVLAELTLPFDRPDVAYFFPLLADTERRLGFRPQFGAFDAAFDAWYTYAHFHQEGQPWETAFAAVPLVHRNSHQDFTPKGIPLCKAGLPMRCKNTFFSKTAYVPHERARYVCPLRYPEVTADTCPAAASHWAKGGCRVTLPTSVGARLRHWIDRESALYKSVYQQRTATERLFSQAVALGIECPKLRNGQAITNRNTLIYILLNLRALHRIRQQQAAQDAQ